MTTSFLVDQSLSTDMQTNNTKTQSSIVSSFFPGFANISQQNLDYMKKQDMRTQKKMEKIEITLFEGENILNRDANVHEWNGYEFIPGELILTNYRCIFRPNNISSYDDVYSPKDTNVPLFMIHRVEKIGGKGGRQEHTYLIEMETKDFRLLRYSFVPAKNTRSKFYKFLSQERTMREAFAFEHKIIIKDKMIDGWKIYDPVKEFTRQGVFDKGTLSPWRISNVNKDFKVCPTYPQIWCVPSCISDEELKNVAAFRSKGRIPALSWYDPKTGIALCRSAQPLVGINMRSKKNKDDHKLIDAILQSNMHSKKMMIVDLRPRANAEANRFVKGAGYEKNYKNCDLRFMGIDNIHVMRNSFMKVLDLCETTGGEDVNFLSKLEATNWLEHIRTILVACRLIVDWIEREKMSILCHCSDGWDRTAQVCSLVEIMLDPYYRTMEGFAVLVEKDWCSFGHMFERRIGHGMRNFFSDDRSPVFFQFLEALYQLMRQHPSAFEYNEALLRFVMDSCYSCRFGTFLGNFEKDRIQYDVRSRTPSIWTYILNNKSEFCNPFYDPAATTYTLYPDVRHSSLRLWEEYWLRYAKDKNGIEYNFPSPLTVLTEKGLDLVEELHNLEDSKNKAELRNERTIETFQKELKSMWDEITQLKEKNREWQLRWETDTTSLLNLCEQQKKELAKWSNGNYEEGTPLKQQEDNVVETKNEEKEEDNPIENDSLRKEIEQLKKERDEWKQKALELDNSSKIEEYKKQIEQLKEKIRLLEEQTNAQSSV